VYAQDIEIDGTLSATGSGLKGKLPNTGCNETLSGYRGSGYRGCKNVTRSGKTCQAWHSLPINYDYQPEDYPNDGLVSNFCRNPDRDTTIWCYTTDGGGDYEFCDPVANSVDPATQQANSNCADASGYSGYLADGVGRPGGGGGYAEYGGICQSDNTTQCGPGGYTFGEPQLTHLCMGTGGGSGAGSGDQTDPAGGRGGNGGGAIKLYSYNDVLIRGTVEADGEDGEGDVGVSCGECPAVCSDTDCTSLSSSECFDHDSGPGGGGSGGSVHITGNMVTIQENGSLTTSGGNGGAGSYATGCGGKGGRGRTRINYWKLVGDVDDFASLSIVKFTNGIEWDAGCWNYDCTHEINQCPTVKVTSKSEECSAAQQCSMYEESRLVTYSDPSLDPDECCAEYECVCLPKEHLEDNEICSEQASNMTCGTNEKVVEDGFLPNTEDCCINYECECRDDLQDVCSQWYDFECEWYERKDPLPSEDCCPRFQCQAVCVDSEGNPINESASYEYDGQCCRKICITDDGPPRLEESCSTYNCDYSCPTHFKPDMSDETIYPESCCKQYDCICDDTTCNNNFTCENGTTRKINVTADGVNICCNSYYCECPTTCLVTIEGTEMEVGIGHSWTVECTPFICEVNDAGCAELVQYDPETCDDGSGVDCYDDPHYNITTIPGDCCDTYECECIYYIEDGVNYEVGDEIIDDEDPCSKQKVVLGGTGLCPEAVEVNTPCPPEDNTTCGDGYQWTQVNVTDCCPVYECVCIACFYNNQTYSPGTGFTDEDTCTQITCTHKRQDDGCFAIETEAPVCVDDTGLHTFTLEVGGSIRPNSCKNITCVQHENCTHELVEDVVTCPPYDSSTDDDCYDYENQTLIENPLQDCCPKTNKVCKTDFDCCGPDYVSYAELLASLEAAEVISNLTSDHECCPKHSKTCPTNVENHPECQQYIEDCEAGFRPEYNGTKVGCCPVWGCVCDQTYCPEREACLAPMEENIVESNDTCCTIYECKCPPDPNPDLVCHPLQELQNVTVCEFNQCGCPATSVCPPSNSTTLCLGTPNCQVTVHEELCGCVLNSTCENGPEVCPGEPICDAECEYLETGPGVPIIIGECTSLCPVYECKPTPCMTPPGYQNVTCEDYEKKAYEYSAGDLNECCPMETCVCKPADELDCPETPEVCSLQTHNTAFVNCCATHDVVCKQESCPTVTCQPGYKKNYPDGEFFSDLPEYNCTDDVKCCPYQECICDVCFYNGFPKTLGSRWLDLEDACIMHTCTNNRSAENDCYIIESMESQCMYNGQYYPFGSTIDDPMFPCQELKCVKENTTTGDCQVTFKYVNKECSQAPQCNDYYKAKAYHDINDCCPTYECVCLECGDEYNGPGPFRDVEWYEKVVNLTLDENPNQACCPLTEIVCDDEKLHLCPANNMTCLPGQYLVHKETDHPCCPEAECVCHDCCISDMDHVLLCQEVVTVPPERNPNHHCCVEEEIICIPDNGTCCEDMMPICSEFEVAVQTAFMDDRTGGCCPYFECQCSGNCSESYIERSEIEASLLEGQMLIQVDEEESCCPVYQVVCKDKSLLENDCQMYDIQCELPFIRTRSDEDVGCCGNYFCKCDNQLCEVPVCLSPKLPVSIGYDDAGCCNVYECQCPLDNTPDPVCEDYQVIGFTDTACPTKYCRCPQDYECNLDGLEMCSQKPGCIREVLERNACGCSINATCSRDDSLCPAIPDCGACFEATEIQNDAMPIGECDSTCPSYTCVRRDCNVTNDLVSTCAFEKVVSEPVDSDACCYTSELICVYDECPSITCEDWEEAEYLDEYHDAEYGCSKEAPCCRKQQCVCNVCRANGTTYELFETWRDPEDQCIRYQCLNTRNGQDGCYTINTVSPTCEYNDQEIPVGYVMSNPTNPCVTLECVENKHDDGSCTYNFNRIDLAPTCTFNIDCEPFEMVTSVQQAGQCCPDLSCVCMPCYSGYPGYGLERDLEWYETSRNATLEENPAQDCCPLIQIICDESKVHMCEQANFTCGYGYRKVRTNDDNECCPEFTCECLECPEYIPLSSDNLATCEMIVEKTEDENPIQLCCPEQKVVCQDIDQCCSVTLCPEGSKLFRTDSMDGCCPEYVCECVPSNEILTVCSMANMTCEVGYRRERTNPIDECCPVYSCVCESCVVDEMAYPVGFSWADDVNHCYVQECTQETVGVCPSINTRPKYQCEEFNEDECLAADGQVSFQNGTDGCCKICRRCDPVDRNRTLTFTKVIPAPSARFRREVGQNVTCTAITEVNVPYCDGPCITQSHYNPEDIHFRTQCKCCKPQNYQVRTVETTCEDNTMETFEYDFATDCKCLSTECVVGSTDEP